MLLALRTLYFEDLSVGMTERLAKTVASSAVLGTRLPGPARSTSRRP
jgi:hypothetical protein